MVFVVVKLIYWMDYPTKGDNMNKTGALLLATLFIVLFVSIQPVYAYPYTPDAVEVENALSYLARAQDPATGAIGSYGDSAWAVMAIVIAGRDKFEGYGGDFSKLMDYIKNNWPADPSACDYARTILAVVAAGENPRHFVTPTGTIDLVDGLIKNFYDGTKICDPKHDWAGGAALTDDWWGIMALISAGVRKDSGMIRNIASYILSYQNADGGWGWTETAGSDVDNTAAAIMGLIVAGNPDPTAIQNALNYLHSQQTSNGGFPSHALGKPPLLVCCECK